MTQTATQTTPHILHPMLAALIEGYCVWSGFYKSSGERGAASWDAPAEGFLAGYE